jgi:hypothetical protein
VGGVNLSATGYRFGRKFPFGTRLEYDYSLPKLGFKSFDAAQQTLVGIELIYMLRRGQRSEEVGQGLPVPK